jgi:hypothetical protein
MSIGRTTTNANDIVGSPSRADGSSPVGLLFLRWLLQEDGNFTNFQRTAQLSTGTRRLSKFSIIMRSALNLSGYRMVLPSADGEAGL